MITQHNKGFTLVELIIVMVMIGIMAGVVFVGYKGVKANALKTEVASDSTNIVDRLELAFTDDKAFPVDLATLDTKRKLEKNPTTSISYESNGTSYCFTAVNTANPTVKYTARDDAKLALGDCSNWTPNAGNGVALPPPTVPAPSAAGVTYTGPTRVKINLDYFQRYVITASGGTCSVGTTEWKLGVTGGSVPYSGWTWQTPNTLTSDVPENGIYSAVNVTIYAKPRCVSGANSTEGSWVQTYNGTGGGTGGSI